MMFYCKFRSMSGDAECQGNSPLAEINYKFYMQWHASARGELHCYSSPLPNTALLVGALVLTLSLSSFSGEFIFSTIRTLHGYPLGIHKYMPWNNATKRSFTFGVVVMVPLP